MPGAEQMTQRPAPPPKEHSSQTRTSTSGRTYESQITHFPSHFSQSRPSDMPGCLRHITRSGSTKGGRGIGEVAAVNFQRGRSDMERCTLSNARCRAMVCGLRNKSERERGL